jgi:urea transport system permease protein
MGVINMAHGEMVMIGAYTTYVVQELIRACTPGLFGWSAGRRHPARLPRRRRWSASRIERSVIRFLYGRPLETLLATWGLSPDPAAGRAHDLRRDTTREVGTPAWMCGGDRSARRRSPSAWNRMCIIVFAARGAGRADGCCCATHALGLRDARGDAEPRAWPPRWASARPASTR